MSSNPFESEERMGASSVDDEYLKEHRRDRDDSRGRRRAVVASDPRSPSRKRQRSETPDRQRRQRSPSSGARSPRAGGRASRGRSRERKDRGDLHGGEDDKPMSILVRHLSYSSTIGDVREAFEKFGPVKDVYLPLEFGSRKPKGFGFIEFEKGKHCTEAIRIMDGCRLDGQVISCTVAQDRRKSPSTMAKIEDSIKGGKGKGKGKGGKVDDDRDYYHNYYDRDERDKGKGGGKRGKYDDDYYYDRYYEDRYYRDRYYDRDYYKGSGKWGGKDYYRDSYRDMDYYKGKGKWGRDYDEKGKGGKSRSYTVYEKKDRASRSRSRARSRDGGEDRVRQREASHERERSAPRARSRSGERRR